MTWIFQVILYFFVIKYYIILSAQSILMTEADFYAIHSYDLIIANNILNLCMAFSAWGSLAGIIIISPSFNR
jgi:hypothetical protein